MIEPTHPLELAARMYPNMTPPAGAGVKAEPPTPSHPLDLAERAAQRLYNQPEKAPTHQVADAATGVSESRPRTEAELAEALYADKSPPPLQFNVPAEVAALREAEMTVADRMYGAPVLPALRDLPMPDDVPREHRVQVEQELTRIATKDLGLHHDDVAGMVSRAQAAKAFTPEQVQANRATAAELLKAEFGARAPEAYAAARALVARDPRVAKLIEGTNLGNDPHTVLVLAKAAVRQKAIGRLK